MTTPYRNNKAAQKFFAKVGEEARKSVKAEPTHATIKKEFAPGCYYIVMVKLDDPRFSTEDAPVKLGLYRRSPTTHTSSNTRISDQNGRKVTVYFNVNTGVEVNVHYDMSVEA